jgi:hypothetical protein
MIIETGRTGATGGGACHSHLRKEGKEKTAKLLLFACNSGQILTFLWQSIAERRSTRMQCREEELSASDVR